MIGGRRADGLYHELPRPRSGRQGKHRTAYVWEVVADPTPDQPFLGRLFRGIDLQRGDWPPGFRFRNVRTGEVWAT